MSVDLIRQCPTGRVPAFTHIGFRARNYDDYTGRPDTDLRKQYLYVGIGLNLSKLLRPYLDIPVFNYLQMPYTYVPFTYQISGPP